MFETQFTTEAEVIAHLSEGKNESCVTALRTRFEEAIDSGITDLNLAAEKAMLLHAHLDHEQGLDVPEGFPFTLDAEAETHLADAWKDTNSDGNAKDRVEELAALTDRTIDLFRLYRAWGVNIFFAGVVAANEAKIQWEAANPTTPDLDESKLFELFELVPDPDLKELIEAVYADMRKVGKSVRESAIYALKAAQFTIQLTSLMLKSKGDDDAYDAFSKLLDGISDIDDE